MVRGLLKRSRSENSGPKLFRLKETNLLRSEDEITGEEAQVAREQSYTDLWLSALDNSPAGEKKQRLAGAAAGSARRGPSANELSYTDVWMKSLAPPPEAPSELQADSDRLKEGQEVKEDDYKILFQVDRPGFGTSYLASHQVIDADGNFLKKVAVLKRYHLLAPKDPDMPDAASRFMKYAKRIAKVSHPNIVPVLDYFVEGEYGYLVHQYLEGFSLKKQIRQLGPLDEKVVVGLLLQMSDMIGHLHDQPSPVVHIDFTPDILQMWRGNTLKLIDLGPDPSRGIFSARAGKSYLKYLAPERVNSKPDERTNMYSMGATLFFLITGRSPVKGVEALHPRSYNKRVSPQLDAIIARLTAADYKDRYASIAELKDCAFMAQLFYGTK
ncbi:MAG: hypothetical protein C0507_17940 [Cyanobacteria bacterium PR.3.49]|jgi:serine/threonine protein kinase|nr:hypothetical protein [Cyanobacteria bacterium PR.3.49]